MKKLLSIFGTMALTTTTASTSIIACDKNQDNKDIQSPWILDPKTGFPKPDKNGKPIPNPKYQPNS